MICHDFMCCLIQKWRQSGSKLNMVRHTYFQNSAKLLSCVQKESLYEKIHFSISSCVDSYLFAPKRNEILKRWTQMPHFVAFQIFSIIRKTSLFLFCCKIRFFSFLQQCRNFIFYIKRVLALKINFPHLKQCKFMPDNFLRKKKPL